MITIINDYNNVILNCPFCGQKGILFEYDYWPDCARNPITNYGIGCDTSTCYLARDPDMAIYSSPEEVIEIWNRRV